MRRSRNPLTCQTGRSIGRLSAWRAPRREVTPGTVSEASSISDGRGRCRGRLTGGVEAGERSKGRGFATSFDFLPADDFGGCIWGSFPRPLYTYSLLPRQMSVTSGAKRLRGRLLSPASSPPVRCPRQRCALLPKQKNIRARGGWRRMKDSGGRGAPRPLI